MEDYMGVLKDFVEKEIKSAEILAITRREVLNCRGIAYGAVMFAQEAKLIPYEDIKAYWDDYAWNKFEEIAKEKDKVTNLKQN